MAMRAAFLARGAGTSVVSPDSCRLRPEYVPQISRIRPKYHAPTLSVAISTDPPTALSAIGTTMCQKDSCLRPEDHYGSRQGLVDIPILQIKRTGKGVDSYGDCTRGSIGDRVWRCLH